MSGDEGRLFVVMLGGRHPRGRTELHDVAFAFGQSLTDTHEQLRAQWFGAAAGLHIDSWLEVDGVDGWQVRLCDQPAAADEPRLFFVNLGGYEDGVFGEAHRYLLVVAQDAAEAKRKGLAQAGAGWIKPHRDALFAVDDCLPVEVGGGRHLRLLPGAHAGIRQGSDYLVLN
ncbi:MAG TPA: DUF1543 domain-containing protein [Xanthomonadaceae bacterium]|nr:DUF1543 domain-containing protein [Xanthomonadaceae bacterium]